MKICQPLSAPLLAIAILAATVAVRSGAAEDELDTAPAMAAAQSWLATVDAGRYGQSWDDASTTFRDGVARDKWEQMVSSVRGQTGSLLSRKVRSATYATKLPNAPAGEYVVIVFDSRFERIPSAVESIVPMKDSDGKWKVAGYVVRPN